MADLMPSSFILGYNVVSLCLKIFSSARLNDAQSQTWSSSCPRVEGKKDCSTHLLLSKSSFVWFSHNHLVSLSHWKYLHRD